MANVKPIPDGYPHVIPSLAVDGAAEAIAFYENVFGAKTRLRMDGPDGKVGHAELEVGTGVIMLADEFPDMDHVGPRKVGGSPVDVLVYVPDVDDAWKRAIAAGAKERQPVTDKFYGDRSGSFEDPWGHHWTIATHVEDVSDDEMMKRAQQAMGGGG
jgi:PhnB protein